MQRIMEFLLGLVEALFRTEIRDIALGGHACAAEKYDILTVIYDIF